MKKLSSSALALLLMLSMLTACGTKTQTEQPDSDDGQAQGETTETEVVTRVGSLSGPTSMGIAKMINEDAEGYTFEVYAAADEIVPVVATGELDIAMIPANLAASLYQRTEGGVQVIGINTLGVLEVIAPLGVEIASFEDLAGQTVYLPASSKGATPEAAVRYLAQQSGIADSLTLDFSNAEPAAVVEALQSNPSAIAILPQPFATVAVTGNEDFEIKFSISNEWSRLAGPDSALVTGVTIVSTSFAEEHPEAVAAFLADAAQSVEFVNVETEQAATMIEEIGIVKAAIAQQAIPKCNLVCITGSEMKAMLVSYLETLEAFDASLIGGKMPDDAFYYEAA